MEMKHRAALIALSLCAGLIGAGPGRYPRQDAKKEGFSVDISVIAITISVTVQDRGGRYINDLTEKDFAVFENNRKRPLTYFQYDFEAPVSLTILLDVSGSMAVQDKLAEVKACLHSFLFSVLKPRDEVSLLIFADGAVEVAVRHTTAKDEVWAVLEKTEAFGKTALNDAVGVSPEFANKGRHEKRALLLMTDGVENDSQCSPDQALEVARRVDVPIYTIGTKIPLDEDALRKLKKNPAATPSGIAATLERFSRATGGKAFFTRSPEEVTAALRDIKDEMSRQYIIGYTAYKNLTNEYRHIRVTTPKKNTRVRTRQGY